MRPFILVLLFFSVPIQAWQNFENISIPQITKPDYQQRLLYKKGVDSIKNKDYNKAIRHLQPLVEKGHLKAIVSLADFLYESSDEKFYKLAHKYHYFAANHNIWKSQIVISYAYMHGNYTNKDIIKARKFLNKAKKNGQRDKILPLFKTLDAKTISEIETKIKEQKYTEVSMIVQQLESFNSQDTKKLLQKIQKYINTITSSMQQYQVAMVQLENKKSSLKERKKAVSVLERLSIAGDSQAQYKLALILLKGDFVSQDIKNGIYWLQTSARQGHVGALYVLGVYYITGSKVKKDEYRAHHIFKLAARKKHRKSMHNLGITYLYGMGVKKDKKKALHWLQMAKKNIKQKANKTKIKHNLYTNINQEQLFKAYEGADWFAKTNKKNRWTLQLLVALNYNTIINFIKENNIKDSYLHYTHQIGEKDIKHILIYGSFASYKNALDYANSISKNYTRFKPWVRSLLDVEKETRL
jgi:TPR repeat protein